MGDGQIHELVKHVTNLESLKAELADKFDQFQAAQKDLSDAASTGKADFVLLSLNISQAIQVYDQTRATSIDAIDEARVQLRTEASTARSRGVPFPEHAAEIPSSIKPGDYTQEQLVATLHQIGSAIQELIKASQSFDELQAQIRSVLQGAKTELARLERLEAHSAEDARVLEDLQTRMEDVSEPREQLVHDAQELLNRWSKHADDVLETRVLEAATELETTLTRLANLGASTADHDAKGKKLEERLDLPESRETLLADLREFNHECQQQAEWAQAKLVVQIEELLTEAASVIEQLHPDMPEVVALKNSLARQNMIQEPGLVSYLAELRVGTSEAGQAGLNALRGYQARVTEEGNYLFTDSREAEQIGTALLAVAGLPEQYSGQLWTICEDVLMRVMVAELDAEAFYDRFGYPTVARALRAAMERDELVKALGFLDTAFLPPKGNSSAERIHTLLGDPGIREVFREAASLGALHLVPEQVSALDEARQRAVITLLEHTDDVALPLQTQLQWTALMYDATPPEGELHHQSSRLLLASLLNARHYVSLYYSLKTLGDIYPDLWSEPIFRPMLRQTVEQALVLEATGRRFLIELCQNPKVSQLVKGDFGYEFFIASLFHYTTTHLGQKELFSETWSAWERLLAEPCPVLADVLHRHLNGEQFGRLVALDAASLEQEYNKLIRHIQERLKVSGYRGVRSAVLIHEWYMKKYVDVWLHKLQSKDFSVEKADQLLTEVSELQRKRDLTEDYQLPQEMSHFEITMRPRIRDNLNNRLFELLELFQQAITIRRQLLLSKGQILPRDVLTKELSLVCQRSDVASWALDHVLAPDLIFIGELKCANIGTH